MIIKVTRQRIRLEMVGGRVRVVRVEPSVKLQTNITVHG